VHIRVCGRLMSRRSFLREHASASDGPPLLPRIEPPMFWMPPGQPGGDFCLGLALFGSLLREATRKTESDMNGPTALRCFVPGAAHDNTPRTLIDCGGGRLGS
jgi:hypothetical protein